jgi:hypothetical protein
MNLSQVFCLTTEMSSGKQNEIISSIVANLFYSIEVGPPNTFTTEIFKRAFEEVLERAGSGESEESEENGIVEGPIKLKGIRKKSLLKSEIAKNRKRFKGKFVKEESKTEPDRKKKKILLYPQVFDQSEIIPPTFIQRAESENVKKPLLYPRVFKHSEIIPRQTDMLKPTFFSTGKNKLQHSQVLGPVEIIQ